MSSFEVEEGVWTRLRRIMLTWRNMNKELNVEIVRLAQFIIGTTEVVELSIQGLGIADAERAEEQQGGNKFLYSTMFREGKVVSKVMN